MPKFKTLIQVTVRAETKEDAHGIAGAAAVYLLENFNDDDSISRPATYMLGAPDNVVIPTALLAALIESADCAADEQEYHAERNREDGEREGAKECAKRALEHRKAFREARTFFNRAVPKPRGKRAKPASAEAAPTTRKVKSA